MSSVQCNNESSFERFFKTTFNFNWNTKIFVYSAEISLNQFFNLADYSLNYESVIAMEMVQLIDHNNVQLELRL